MSLTKSDLQLTNYMVNGASLVANVIYEAIKCKTYPTLPRKIDAIVEKVTALYKRDFERVTSDFYLRQFDTYDELMTWLKENITPIPEIQEMNLSKSEFDAGVTVDSDDRPKYCFTSRYSAAVPEDDDFVDLGAFTRNLAHDLMRENIEINYSTF